MESLDYFNSSMEMLDEMAKSNPNAVTILNSFKDGACGNLRGVGGKSILMLDCVISNSKVMAELLEHNYLVGDTLKINIDAVDKNGATPLMHAVLLHGLESIHELLDHGADILKKDIDGFSAVDYSLDENRYKGMARDAFNTLSAEVHSALIEEVELRASNKRGDSIALLM